jgi:hypothetical protein
VRRSVRGRRDYEIVRREEGLRTGEGTLSGEIILTEVICRKYNYIVR